MCTFALCRHGYSALVRLPGRCLVEADGSSWRTGYVLLKDVLKMLIYQWTRCVESASVLKLCNVTCTVGGCHYFGMDG